MNIVTNSIFTEDVKFFIALMLFLAFIIGTPFIFRKQLRKWSIGRPLLVYTLKRILTAIFTLFLIITVVFLLLRLFPKENYLDRNALNKIGPEHRDAIKQQVYRYYGFDKPILQQLFNFYKNIFPFPKEICFMTSSPIETVDAYGKIVEPNNYYCAFVNKTWINLGNSNNLNLSAVELIKQRAPVSFSIALPTLILSMLLGYPLGILMAKNKGKLIDHLGIGYESIILAIPAIVIYGVSRSLFTSAGFPTYFIKEDFSSYIPPIITGVLVSISAEAYYVRRYVVDQMSADYVKFARAKGLSENRIMFTHIFRNVLPFIIRSLPASIIFSFTGGYFIERLFMVPGMGKTLIDSLSPTKPDIDIVQSLVLIYAIMSLIAYVLSDLVVAMVDPRVSYTKNK